MATSHNKTFASEWLARLKLAALVTLASSYIRLLRLTCRIDVVSGSEHVDAALIRGVVIPCSWHQHIMPSALFLRQLVPRGLKTGFLTSPSRDGELTTRVAHRHGTWVMRGSSSRTGRQALKALIRGVEQGISPTIYPDGPRGPAHVFKPGAIMLARHTGAAIMPVSCAARHYWQVKSWDSNRIPRPFTRLTIAVGELRPVARDETDITALARELGDTLDELTRLAEAAH